MTHDELIKAAAKALYEHDWREQGHKWMFALEEEKRSARRQAAISLAIYEPLIRADERAKENEACHAVALSMSNYGHIEGNKRAFRIADGIRSRMGGE